MIVWGRVAKRDRWGRKVYAARPEESWVRVDAPELRIVDDDLWDRAQRRLALTRALYAESGSRAPLDRDASPRAWHPQRREYLLSGIAKCAECGGSLVAFTRDMKAGGRRVLYGCNYRAKRGATICGNAVLIKQEKLDRVVLDAIAEALDERLLERAIEKAVAKLGQRRHAAPGRRAEAERELADVEARLQRGVDALLAGTAVADELRVRLAAEKERKAALTAELAAPPGAAWLPAGLPTPEMVTPAGFASGSSPSTQLRDLPCASRGGWSDCAPTCAPTSRSVLARVLLRLPYLVASLRFPPLPTPRHEHDTEEHHRDIDDGAPCRDVARRAKELK